MEERFNNLSVKKIAVIAVRENNIPILKIAIEHLSRRTNKDDPNDIISDLTLIYHSAKKLQTNPDDFLLNNSITNAKFHELVKKFIARKPEDKTIKSMGYIEIDTPEFDYKFKLF